MTSAPDDQTMDILNSLTEKNENELTDIINDTIAHVSADTEEEPDTKKQKREPRKRQKRPVSHPTGSIRAFKLALVDKYGTDAIIFKSLFSVSRAPEGLEYFAEFSIGEGSRSSLFITTAEQKRLCDITTRHILRELQDHAVDYESHEIGVLQRMEVDALFQLEPFEHRLDSIKLKGDVKCALRYGVRNIADKGIFEFPVLFRRIAALYNLCIPA